MDTNIKVSSLANFNFHMQLFIHFNGYFKNVLNHKKVLNQTV